MSVNSYDVWPFYEEFGASWKMSDLIYIYIFCNLDSVSRILANLYNLLPKYVHIKVDYVKSNYTDLRVHRTKSLILANFENRPEQNSQNVSEHF